MLAHAGLGCNYGWNSGCHTLRQHNYQKYLINVIIVIDKCSLLSKINMLRCQLCYKLGGGGGWIVDRIEACSNFESTRRSDWALQ